MHGLGKDPAFMLTVALGTFAVGGFLAISHLGKTSAPVQMSAGFSSRFAPEKAQASAAAPSSHLENFRRGVGALKAQASSAAAGFGFSFGGPSPAPRTAASPLASGESWRAGSSSSRGGYEDDGPRDWASSYYKGPKGLSAGGSSSWAASGGGESKTGADAAGNWTASGGESGEGQAPEGEEMSEVDAEAVARYARAQASPGAAGQAASAMYASLPSRGGPSSASPAGGHHAQGGSYSGVPPGNTGSVSGMRGGVSGADLGGAAESQRADAMDLLKFRADGATTGGEVKAVDASQLRVVEGGGSTAGGSSGSSGGSGGAGGSGASSPRSSGGSDQAGGSPSGTTPSNTPKAAANNARPEAQPVLLASALNTDLLQDIASEKLNGRDEKYIRAAAPGLKSADAPAETPLEELLAPRTIHPSHAASGSEKSAAADRPDPETIEDVRGARREAIKAEMHVFLHKLESRYGKMSDIQRVSCSSDRDNCREHGLRGAYITMATSTGAKLALGLKRGEPGTDRDSRADRRGPGRAETGNAGSLKWRLYTIDFMDGEGRRPGDNRGAVATEDGNEDAGQEGEE